MPRLLIVKTTSLGDVIHNLPVINDIRTHLPEVLIDWVVEESFADIPQLHSGVDTVIAVAMRRWRKQPFSAMTWQQISAVKKAIQSRSYLLALDTQGLLKSALITRFANAPRHGYNSQSIREPLASYFYDAKHAVSKNQHAVVRNRQLAAQALGYAAPTSPPDYGIAGIDANPVIGNIELPAHYVVSLHGSSRDSKLWPTGHWIALASHLHGRGLALVLPWGTPAEHERALHIAAHTPQSLVLPKLRLSALAAIIGSAKAAIGVDTGLMHLAVALKIASVAIYTDTDPALTGIYPGENTVAINMGGKNQTPTVAEIIRCLDTHSVI